MSIFSKATAIFVFIFAGTQAYSQTASTAAERICKLIDQKSFIKAKQLYETEHERVPAPYKYYINACLSNSFNKLEESERNISKLLTQRKTLPDTLMAALYEIRQDNAIKLYKYREAAEAISNLLNNYRQYLSSEKIKDLQNDLTLWSALKNTPPQTITIKDNTSLRIREDKAGLKNLDVSNGTDSLQFIFDTGANISTLTSSAAAKMRMAIIPAAIKVTAITGKQVTARLAVCNKLIIGNIELYNTVFLVFDDADLSFPQINYHINGILGFPVIEAMKEIQITKDGYFKVPGQTDNTGISPNLALNGLIPLVFIGDAPFTLDTGADRSLLYRPYYIANRDSITKNYQPTTISFGGAGGGKKVNGYHISAVFEIAGKQVRLPGVDLITDEVKNEKGICGNIGQDVIMQFNSMTLNFDKMFIRFK